MWIWSALLCAQAGSLPDTLAGELGEAMGLLAERPEAPHYGALVVTDQQTVSVSARTGTLSESTDDRARYLDVDLRVGTAELDSTHQLRGFSALEGDGRRRLRIPLTDGPALEHTVWQELDRAYREAAERIVVVRANRSVKVEEESPASDFEPRSATVDSVEVPPLEVDRAAWEAALAEVSARVQAASWVHGDGVSLEASRVHTTFVDSEGTRLEHGRRRARVSLQVWSTADDGDVVQVFRATDVHDPAALPDRTELLAWADAAVTRLDDLRNAPRGDPHSGPVLLEGKAAGVFFHEVMGHRVEGHRQKREDEGKTFAEHVGKPVLPTWIDVFDDPTVVHDAGEDLNGHYAYDDEGIAAQRADLVDDGVFVGFLTHRSPIPGFEESNGHGRRSVGHAPVARMGNTIVRTARPVPRAELRKRLVRLVREQGLDYGYVVDEIDGGFTMTGRITPNAFNVRASTTWRVWADGRPDELVRGIDLVGTPFVAFHNLVATGDDPQVFNGTCGAESGWVPVSAVSPSLLFSRLEFQLKEKGQERPPLLAKPGLDDGTSDAGGAE